MYFYIIFYSTNRLEAPCLAHSLLYLDEKTQKIDTHGNMNILTTRRTFTYVTIFFLFAITFFCIGCHKQESAADKKTTVITATFYPLYIMLENITDNVSGVSINLMAPAAAGCLHDYQITVSDMKKLDESTIIVCNGAGMESFMEKYLANPAYTIITASDGLPLLYDGHRDDDGHYDDDCEEHGHHHDHGDVNPHIWVSIQGAIGEVRTIAQSLAAADAAHAAAYTANADRYISQLKTLDADMKTSLAPYRGAKIVTFHEAFPYFAQDFGLEIAAVIEEEADAEPSAKELLAVIDIIKQYRITALFAEPQYSAAAADVISAETGVPVSILDPCVTGPLVKDAYITTMKQNMAVLRRVLGEHGNE